MSEPSEPFITFYPLVGKPITVSGPKDAWDATIIRPILDDAISSFEFSPDWSDDDIALWDFRFDIETVKGPSSNA